MFIVTASTTNKNETVADITLKIEHKNDLQVVIERLQRAFNQVEIFDEHCNVLYSLTVSDGFFIPTETTISAIGMLEYELEREAKKRTEKENVGE